MKPQAAQIENWHKRHALMLGSQLPDNAADANAVIQALQSLVDTWMHPERDHPAPSKVIALVRDKD
jgi:hypothetical protein